MTNETVKLLDLIYPPIGSKVRCLRAPSFAVPETAEAMIGQVGTITAHYLADPVDLEEGECLEDLAAVGIQYPLTPYRDNRIALRLSDWGKAWDVVENGEL